MSEKSQNTETNFGFTKIPTSEKQSRVRGVFDAVADRYDIMNDMMSVGLHRLWKNHMIRRLPLHAARKPMTMVDVAGGTGDIAFRALKSPAGRNGLLDVRLIDINAEMLRVGYANAQKQNLDHHIQASVGNAEALPLEDKSCDIYTIAFGIRNVTHRDAALKEAWRVLKPGGVFACLEFSNIPNASMMKAYDAYSFNLIPPMGRLVTGDAAPYKYLVESIRTFPAADDFATEVKEAGFERVRHERLSAGIVALHLGWRPL